MPASTKNLRIVLSASAMAVVTAILVHAYEPAAPRVHPAGVVLRIAACVDKSATTLAFVLENKGDVDLVTTPMCTNYNRLIFVKPDGKEREEFAWKKRIPPVVITPSETKTWYVDLARRMKLDQSGLYSVRWKVGDDVSAEFFLLK